MLVGARRGNRKKTRMDIQRPWMLKGGDWVDLSVATDAFRRAVISLGPGLRAVKRRG